MRFLCHSPDIALGIERYHLRVEQHTLGPAHFAPERFFDMQSGDTWYDSLSKFPWHYDRLSGKYASARYVGDKVPTMFNHLGYMIEQFPNAKVLFTLRDPEAVARSYEMRIGTPDWPPKRDRHQAKIDWDKAFAVLQKWRDEPNVFTVRYEPFADGTFDLDALTDFLGLERRSLDTPYRAIRAERGRVPVQN